MICRLRAFWTLPSLERRTIVKAVVLNPAMLVALKTWGTRRTAAMVKRWSSRRLARRRQPLDDGVVAIACRIGASVNRAAADPAPAVTCLARSLTAQLLLRRRGIDAELRIGVGRADETADALALRPGQAPLLFHAWVEVGGVAVNDRADIAEQYAAFPLAQLELSTRRLG